MTHPSAKLPVIYLAYANERTQHGYLSELTLEMKSVLKVLERPYQEDRCHVKVTPAATQQDIQEVFQDPWYDGRIRVFHYSGHSDEDELWLENQTGGNSAFFSLGLARFLGAQQGIHLVFLNGCANQEHAQLLLDAKIPVVIATSRKINDTQARIFAEVFYKGLAGGTSIGDAFKEAEGIVLGQFGESGVRPADGTRSLFWRKEAEAAPEEKEFPWKLFTSGENAWFPTNWRLFQRENEMGEMVSLAAHQLVGKRLDNYQLLEVLGEGSTGWVFKARHVQLNEERALKLSHPIVEGFERLRTVLASGYKGLQAISSPYLAKVYDVAEDELTDEERMYIVMEMVGGQRLDTYGLRAEMLRTGNATPLTELAIPLAQALRIAHETQYVDENGLPRTGLYHGNLKIRKVFVQPDGSPKLIDFYFTDMTRTPGVRLSLPPSSQMKEQGEDLASYFPPEVISGQVAVNAQTDIFGLGALLIEAGTGSPVHQLAPANPEQLHHFLEQKGVKVPKKLAQTLFMATHPNPRVRYKTMADFLRDLEKSTSFTDRILYRFRRRK